jgi:hypothetical protein
MKSLHSVFVFIAGVLILISASGKVWGQTGSSNPSSGPVIISDQASRQERWFQRGRIIPGQSAAALRYRAHQQKMWMRVLRAETSQSPQIITESWIPLGPAPLASDASGTGIQDYGWVSGRATSVAIDPADPSGNTVYVGGAYGGVWKSINAGSQSADPASVKWIAVTDSQATLAVGSIAIQPQLTNANPANSVILVGTGESNGSADSYYGLGIMRSSDAGITWTLATQDTTQTRSFAGLAFGKLAFSTISPNRVVAAAAAAPEGIAEGLENPVAANRGIYYSADGGISWTYATVSDGTGTPDPSSVSSVIYNAAAGQFFAASSLHGFYSSLNGSQWTRLPNQPGTGLTTTACPSHTASPSTCPIYRGEISVVPGRDEMYVWYVDVNDNDQGIWQSTDGGTTWTQINDAGITNCGDVFGGCGTSQGRYNLELAAVPDGSATDLYAGAVNLYKCRITAASPSCAGTGTNTFFNLTHVYGCSSIALVHPNQHAIGSQLIDNAAEDILYFANDGGIYRALDGYTDLTTGACGGSNQFDSLNLTLGSMSQFVSFSQSSTDPSVILGGAGDNGTPASAAAEGNSSWLNVNAGDGGYATINPANEDEWFIATPPDSVSGVNIFGCAAGINCHTDDFINNQIVSSTSVGGDIGAFYLPYMLDPQNSSELLVGTCRVWQGPSNGGAFSLLSNNFESGGSAICSGNETNLVRSLAAGGAVVNGFSNVIYAGTDGFGPLLSTSPAGGKVWVSTNAAGGDSTWTDQTGAINPDNFPISGIAIDSSDGQGLTAYVTIMGFHVSHVWQTKDGGASWTDFTANLPDAPVNAVVVDPGTGPTSGTIYVGTDAGVFFSSTSAANWSEVGPSSGQTGFLPNVAVTSLKIFNNQETKRLRASTYGRGIWELNLITSPDFQIDAAQNPLTAFAGESAVFAATITALNGYTSMVSLSCTSGTTVAPPNCLVAPRNLTPGNSGSGVTVTASGPAGDYLFNLHGVGADSNTVTRDLPLFLSVVDFNLTPLSPVNIAVTPPNITAPITFQVTAAGSFHGAVNLSCLGLPVGGSCNFTPATASPTSTIPVNVTLTIGTTANTPTGPFSIMVVGATAGGPNKVQSLTLFINAAAAPNYMLTISNPALSALVSTTATFNGTLTSVNGYSSQVNLSCGAGAPPSCAAVPAIATPSTAGEPFTVIVSSVSAQNYSFNIISQGMDASSITQAAPVTFSTATTSNGDFSISNTSGPQTVPAGTAAQYVLTFTPIPAGSTFSNSVSYTCSSSPVPLSSCSFAPLSPIPANGLEAQITLTVTTTAAIASVRGSSNTWIYAIWLPSPGLLFLSGLVRRRRHRYPRLIALVAMLGITVACSAGLQGFSSGAGEPGTPAGTYTVTVNANEGSLSHSLQVTLIVQ